MKKLMILCCFAFSGCGSDVQKVEPVQPQKEVVVPKQEQDGFHYRGILLDIDTRNNSVQFGPHHYYSMGYIDGYGNHEMNPGYKSKTRYIDGYMDGLQKRTIEHLNGN